MVDRGSAIFMCQNVYQKLAKKFARTKNNQIFMHKYIKNKAFMRYFLHKRLFSGGRSGTRTLGPLIKSQLLYQLS